MRSEQGYIQDRRLGAANRPAAGRGPRRRGVTLLEVILALALIITMMAAAIAFYHNAVRARTQGSQVAQEAIQMRAMLTRLAEEIRHTVNILPGDGKGFQGTEESITIVRTRLPENYAFDEYDKLDTLPPAQMDLMRVTYHLYWDEEERTDEQGIPICYGLWRTEQKTFDPRPNVVYASAEPGEEVDTEQLNFPQPEGELYAPEIKYLRFEYYDGVKWRDRWNVTATGEAEEESAPAGGPDQGGVVLPQAVRITIGKIREPREEDEMDMTQLKDKEEERKLEEYHPDRYTIVVYLPQADRSLLSSTKKGSSDDRDQMGEQTSG